MTDSSDCMIESSARNHGINHKDSVECLLVLYAFVFQDIEKDLNTNVFPPESTRKFVKALNTISTFFNDMQGNELRGEKIDDEKCENIKYVNLKLIDALACVDAALTMYTEAVVEHGKYSDEFYGMLPHYNKNLLRCRKYIAEINHRIGWWCKDEETEDCKDLKSAG